ncbi:uncharacterized protein LOC132752799 isoform X1 [Ruditapes philippinarum]|uniref:uncharacterized protein LOC132752799 isoform X1 n=1 Tax=Ruditapes philippinarum TaxID=129788 RepID=UPI00295BFB37|nr:uncharacterized protein LOC132752799 isoform X1 [Ruditapes philippinarum]
MASVEVQAATDNGLPSLARNGGRKKRIKGSTPPPPMNAEEIPWRGHGGRAPTMSSVEFDRQLDKIAVWVEEWNHEQRCQIVEGILRRSNYNQFQFLNTSLQPILHRDFMYTARTQFPAIEFQPVSTHTSRKLKEKLIYTRQDNYHRIKSAHLQDDTEVKQQIQEKESLRLPLLSRSNGVSPVHSTEKQTAHLLTITPRKKPRRSPSLDKNNVDKWVGEGNPLYSSQPNLSRHSSIRYIDMPIRRHIQDERSPRQGSHVTSATTTLSSNTGHSKSTCVSTVNRSLSTINNHRNAKLKQKNERGSELNLYSLSIPDEAITLFNWYSQNWSDVKRNEFLHKFMLKLDPRQHYFVSSFLAARQHKDFISLLPKDISLKILHYLTVQDLLRCCMVSKTWNILANNNDLWKHKCECVKMEVPVTDQPEWKKLYKDNKYLRVNWNSAKCKITDFKGHSDSVICVIFDHVHLASGSLDKTIRVWNIKTGKCLHVFKGHVKGVWCLNFFTHNLLISGSYDGTIRVWNLRTGKCNKTIIAHDGPIWALTRHNEILVTVSQDKTAKVWDMNRCLHINSLLGHTAAIFAVDMSEDGHLVITGSADKSVKIWNIETGRCLRWISVSQTTSIMSVSYSQGHLACSYGETICVYKVEGPTRLLKKYLDIVNEHQKSELTKPKRIECLKLSILDKEKGEGIIVSAGKDGAVKYWDIKKDKSVQTFVGHRGREVNAIYFDELRISSASVDNKIRIWDFNV